MSDDSTASLNIPCLMLVTDRNLAGGGDALVTAVEAAVSGGVNAVQLREKDMRRAELLSLARQLRDVTRGRAIFLVNSSLAVALSCDADGVHLPEDLSMVDRPRRRFMVGRSVPSVEAARRAHSEGVDYIIAGPVYETDSHPGAPAAGLGLVETIAKTVATPVIAIGGINTPSVANLLHSGACGVAVISAILGAPRPGDAALEMRAALDGAWQNREATTR